MSEQLSVPVVLVFSGADPTGGAGIQADIEALASMGCHAAPVITALTIQDTQRVHSYSAVDATLVISQARTVLEDMHVSAVKIGMVGSVANVESIHSILRDYPDVPVVLDPVLKSGLGDPLSSEALVDAMTTLLFPLTTLLTPNSNEARELAPEADSLEACAHRLLDFGCEYVLITGTHEATPTVQNQLYGNHRLLQAFTWERLPHSYHGSGCTLAAATAGLVAQGADPIAAVRDAQQYTWEALHNGYRVGMGQHLPNRLFWGYDGAGDEIESP
jgi:hydroxymethylpyrimidine/phosphomethylpyrimidine kinase